LPGVVLSSTLALGLLAGLFILISGYFTMSVDGDLEIGPFEGLYLVLELPILSIPVFLLLSPLSFLISRLLSRCRDQSETVKN